MTGAKIPCNLLLATLSCVVFGAVVSSAESRPDGDQSQTQSAIDIRCSATDDVVNELHKRHQRLKIFWTGESDRGVRTLLLWDKDSGNYFIITGKPAGLTCVLDGGNAAPGEPVALRVPAV